MPRQSCADRICRRALPRWTEGQVRHALQPVELAPQAGSALTTLRAGRDMLRPQEQLGWVTLAATGSAPERRGSNIDAVRDPEVSRRASRDPRHAVLPDDALGLPVQDDDAMIVVVVEDDVAGWEFESQRRMVQCPGAGRPRVGPQHLSAPRYDEDLPRPAVIRDKIVSCGGELRVRGVGDRERNAVEQAAGGEVELGGAPGAD